MDTDDLSNEAYKAVLVEAEKLTHDLTIHFGVLANDCKDETEYLAKAKQLSMEIKQYDDFDLEDFLFGNVPEKSKLISTLDKIISNIEAVNKIPIEKRHYEF